MHYKNLSQIVTYPHTFFILYFEISILSKFINYPTYMISAKRKKNIKFLTVYNSFTETERNEFSIFIKIGLNGNKRNYNRILSSLIINDKGIVDIPEVNISRTRWNRLSELHLLADKFLAIKSAESDRLLHKYLILKEYHKRNLSIPIEQNIENIFSEITKEPIINNYYSVISQIENIYLDHLRVISNSKKYAAKFNDSFKISTGIYLIELLDHLIQTRDLKLTKTINSESLVEEIFSEFNFKKILLIFSRTSKSPDKIYHTIKFLYLIYLSQIDPENNDNYINAKRIFFNELNSISKENKAKFYNYMIDIIIERINHNIPGAAKELFFLINKKLKEGLTEDIEYKDLQINSFRDILIIAINLGKYTWVKNFIKKYSSKLPVDIRDDYVNMGLAILSFHEKKYLLCNDLLSKIKKRNPYNFIDIFILKLKVLFELKDIVECHAELKKFKEYLRKEHTVQDLLRVYSNEFCKAISLLLKLNQSPTLKNLNDLQFLISTKVFIGKSWITLKMNDIALKFKLKLNLKSEKKTDRKKVSI